MSIDDVADIIY